MLFQRHNLNLIFLPEQRGELSTSSKELHTRCRLLTPGSPVEEHSGGLSLRVTGCSEDKKPAKPRQRKGTSGYLISPVTVSSGFLPLYFPLQLAWVSVFPQEKMKLHTRNPHRGKPFAESHSSVQTSHPLGACAGRVFLPCLFIPSSSPPALIAPSTQLVKQPD